MHVRVGTSGWSYKQWKGTFSPSDLPADGMLRHSALLPVFTLALGTAGTVVLYALLARLFGQAWIGWAQLWRVALVEAGFSLFFAPISLPVCRWAMAGSLEARSASV